MARYVKSGTVNTVQEINSELEKIATAQDEFLTRNGETPNEMKNTLDMNSNRIINLKAPVSGTDAARLVDVTGEYDITVGIDETPVFDNIAVMTSTTLTVGQLARCKRYYVGGDLVEGLVYEIQASQTVDGYADHTLSNGNIAKLNSSDNISTLQCGGIQGANSDQAISAWLQHPQKNKLLVGDFLVTNISETVSNINVYGGGSLSSTSGASSVVTLTGDNNIISEVSITSQLNQQQQSGILTFVGNENQAISNNFGWDVFLDPVLEGEQYGSHGVSLSGNENIASNNHIFNTNTGVLDVGINNVISFNTINKTARGVELQNRSRYAKVIGNYIDCGYAGLGLGGCDGIWGNRNHRYSFIDGNTILFAGEHGTYLQGDSYTVTNNIVRKCNNSGIKAGAKSTDNFWYVGETVEELAPNGDYTGFDIVIANNVCSFNEVSGGTTAEIYLQPNLMNVTVKNNVIRDGGAWGIRSVFFSGSPNDVMKGITFSGNQIHNCVAGSISCASSDIALISNNIVDGLIQTDSRDNAEPLTNCTIQGNSCANITIFRATNPIVSDNVGTHISLVSDTATLKGNIFSAQENGNFNSRVISMVDNKFTYNGLITASQISLQGCDDVQGNYFTFPDATASYPLDVIFNSATPTNGAFNNNEVSAVNSPRPARIGGSNSTINGNRIYGNGASDFTFGVYADNCVISGNVTNAGIIRLETGSSNNIVNGNASKITDSGTANLLSNNRP